MILNLVQFGSVLLVPCLYHACSSHGGGEGLMCQKARYSFIHYSLKL